MSVQGSLVGALSSHLKAFASVNLVIVFLYLFCSFCSLFPTFPTAHLDKGSLSSLHFSKWLKVVDSQGFSNSAIQTTWLCFVGYSAFASISVLQHCPHSLYRPQFSSFLVLLVPSRYPSTNTFEYLRKSSNPPNFPASSRQYLWIPTEIMSKSAKIGKGYVECNVSAKKGTSLGVAHFCHKA